MRIHIGTSGFQYAHWNNGVFYPRGVKDRLAYALERFDTVEINSTFYRIPPPDTVSTWMRSVPAEARLILKAPQSVSHRRRLKLQGDPGIKQGADLLHYFIDGNLRIPPANRGPALLQLPGRMQVDLARLEPVLQLFAERGMRVALEVRHESWFTGATFDLLQRFGAALVASDWITFRTPLTVTSDFIYVRRHGPGSLYASSYGDEQLQADIDTIRAQPVQDAYVMFNNDIHGYAPQNAMRMIELARGRDRGMPVRPPVGNGAKPISTR